MDLPARSDPPPPLRLRLIRTFIQTILTCPHRRAYRACAFLRRKTVDPYIRKFVSTVWCILTISVLWTSGLWAALREAEVSLCKKQAAAAVGRLYRASYPGFQTWRRRICSLPGLLKSGACRRLKENFCGLLGPAEILQKRSSSQCSKCICSNVFL